LQEFRTNRLLADDEVIEKAFGIETKEAPGSRKYENFAPCLQGSRCSDKVNTLLWRRFFSTGTFVVLAVSN
jgi:hypothetical protein